MLGEHRVHRRLGRRAGLPAGRGAGGRVERVAQRRLVDLDRPADRGLGGGGERAGRQRRRRLARLDEVADRASDDLVGAAVVELAREREDVGDVGGRDEALARDLRRSAPAAARCRRAPTRSAARSRPPRRAPAGRCRSGGGSGRSGPSRCAARRARAATSPAAWPAWVRIAASA